MITTSQPSPRSVHVQVLAARSKAAARQCGLDSGYAEVECRDARGLFEVVKRSSGRDEMPSLMGRYYDRNRGSILIQTWGPADAKAEQLVRALLSDPLLGEHTSAALNAEGQELTAFGELKSTVEVQDGP